MDDDTIHRLQVGKREFDRWQQDLEEVLPTTLYENYEKGDATKTLGELREEVRRRREDLTLETPMTLHVFYYWFFDVLEGFLLSAEEHTPMYNPSFHKNYDFDGYPIKQPLQDWQDLWEMYYKAFQK